MARPAQSRSRARTPLVISHDSDAGSGLLWALGLSAVAVLGIAALALRRPSASLVRNPSKPPPPPPPKPRPAPVDPNYDAKDIEALARMVASENPRASDELHVEQIFTQMRQAKRYHQRLYDRVTAGQGYGKQNDKRPVSTAEDARQADRDLVRSVLDGDKSSRLPGATKYFEPDQSDKAFAVAERARAKQKQGEKLTANETRLLGYHKNADMVRADWAKGGTHAIDTIDGVEFWT